MLHTITEEFSGLSASRTPSLFTHTREFRFHSARGSLVHRKLPAGPKGYTVVAVASTGHRAKFVEQDRVALTVPIAGRSEVAIGGRQVVTGVGGMLALAPSERDCNLVPGYGASHYRSFTIIAPASIEVFAGEHCLQHRAVRSVRELNEVIELAFRVSSVAGAASGRALALVEALVEDGFLEALARTRGLGGEEGGRHRHEHVARIAQAYVEAYCNDALSITDIARAAAVGARRLQMALRHTRGITPKKLLAEARLRAMHRQLIRAEANTTVTLAAMDSGILHVGRGIAAYRKMYGESPATTLRRARCEAG